jgi:hypothetical protein
LCSILLVGLGWCFFLALLYVLINIFSCILQLQMGDITFAKGQHFALEAREWQHICLNEILSSTHV